MNDMSATRREAEPDAAHAARIALLGELATSIVHEVRQPLAAIVTNAEASLRWLAREDPNLAKVVELMGRIAASAERANDIVQRIQTMARRHAPERRALDLAQVVDDALHFVRHDLDHRAIALSVEVEPGLPPVVGDRIQLQQVLVNLLVNAIHAIDHDGAAERRIEVAVQAHSVATAVLVVRDTGPGIAEADLAHLFESFFTTKATGLGVGLTISRAIVLEHGGAIDAGNHAQGGAVFRVTLPFGAG